MSTPLRPRDFLLLAAYSLLLSAVPLCCERTFTVHETVGCVNIREMRADGDWVIPHYGGRPWLERPPLPFWLTQPFVSALGDVPAAYRLPPALVALGCVLLAGWMASVWFGRGVGLLAGLILATIREFVQYSTGPESDMFLSGVVTVAIALFVHLEFRRRPAAGEGGFLLGKRPPGLLAFFVALGLANLVKGLFFGDLMILLPVAAYLLPGRGMWALVRRYVWLPGWLAFAAAGSAWAATAYFRYPDIVDLWKSDYAGRLNAGYMREPAWYYLAHLPWVLFPWTIAAFVGLGCTWRRALTEGRKPVRFLWCWAVVPVVAFSVPQGKHHHYLLHLLAPWAVLAALGTLRLWQWLPSLAWLRRPWPILAAVALPGEVALLAAPLPPAVPAWLLPAALVVWPCVVLACWWIFSRPDWRLGMAGLFTLLVPAYGAAHLLMPLLEGRYAGDRAFVERVRAAVSAGARLLVLDACGPLDASWMLYYLPGRAELLHNATFLRDERHGEELYLITRRFHAPLLGEYGSIALQFESARSRDEWQALGAQTRYGLYRLRLHAGLARAEGPVYISPMQATGRAPGPEMTGPAGVARR
jgi:4-amino-4-deoxy-L-arabinose transferase-like glycosyltransferase